MNAFARLSRRIVPKDMAIVFTCGKCSTRAIKSFSKQSYEKGLVMVRGCILACSTGRAPWQTHSMPTNPLNSHPHGFPIPPLEAYNPWCQWVP